MPTIFTVGAGGTHPTLQAAWNAIPVTLADQYIIRLKNQEFVFTGSASALITSARTTTPSFDIIIEPEPGAGFKDNVNVRNNALRYNPANGAAIKVQDASAIVLAETVNHLTIRGLQIKQEASPLASFDIVKCLGPNISTNQVFKDLIIEQSGSDFNDCLFLTGQSKVINCLIIHGGNNLDTGIKLSDFGSGYAATIVGCTVVRPSNLPPAGIGIFNKFSGNTLNGQNNAVFGFLTDVSQWTTGDYNATSFSDAASGLPDPVPDHNVYDVVYNSALFEQPSSASGLHDYRLKSPSALVNAGLFDGTNSPQDISGFNRNNPPEIGAWEMAPLTASGVISVHSRLSGVGFQQSAPFKIDDRTIELPHFGKTQRGVRLDPIIVGDDFRLRRTYTGLTTGAIIVSAEFTVKRSLRDADNQALIRKQITTSLTAEGQITDPDAAGGSISMYFEALSAQTGLARFNTDYPYYIKVRTSTGQTHTLETGIIPFLRT